MKVFIACSKWFYNEVNNIKKQLEFMGYEVILPNFFDTPMIEEEIKKELSKEEHIDFCRKSFLESQEKSRNSDIILVLNFDKEKDGKIYHNYIGGATFLEMYDSYILGHKIYLYNEIPNGMLSDEIEGMNPVVINGNLFNIKDNYVKFNDNNLLKYFTLEELKKISDKQNLISKSKTVISKVFENKKDKAGKPYVNHLLRVSNKLDTEYEKVAGLLHDIVEDTEVTFADLIEIGIPLEIIEVINLVTNKKIDKRNLSKEEKLKIYNDKIDSIINSGNISAINLKESDMSDNYDLDRLSQLPIEKQEWFHEKYGKQLIKLRNAKNNI